MWNILWILLNALPPPHTHTHISASSYGVENSRLQQNWHVKKKSLFCQMKKSNTVQLIFVNLHPLEVARIQYRKTDVYLFEGIWLFFHEPILLFAHFLAASISLKNGPRQYFSSSMFQVWTFTFFLKKDFSCCRLWIITVIFPSPRKFLIFNTWCQCA